MLGPAVLISFTGFPTDMTAAVSKAWESTGGVLPRELVPQQRMGNAEELAGTILYLASKVSINVYGPF